MGPRWLTAFIDRPAVSFESGARFWGAVTGSTLSAPRGAFDEFATLLPPDGDAYLRVQRVEDGPGGSHLDVHVADTCAFAAQAVAAGAGFRHPTRSQHAGEGDRTERWPSLRAGPPRACAPPCVDFSR